MIREILSARVFFCTLLCALMLLSGPSGGRAADGTIALDDQTNVLNLSGLSNAIVAQRRDISVQGLQENAPVMLTATGPGPRYFWSLYSFRNTARGPLSLVMTFKPTREQLPNALSAILTQENVKLAFATQQAGMQVVRFQIPTNEKFTVAVESLDPELKAVLWQARAFDAATELLGKTNSNPTIYTSIPGSGSSHVSYFQGLMEGMVLVIFIWIFTLWGYRLHRALLAGWLFVFVSGLFIESHGGYLLNSMGFGSSAILSAQVATASLMSAVLAFCILTFLGVTSFSSVLGIAMMVAAGFSGANIIYAAISPSLAGIAAKAGFAALVVIGLIASYRARNQGKAIVDPNLLFWFGLLIWVIFAAGAFLQPDSMILVAILQAMLVAVLILMAFALTRFTPYIGFDAPEITDANQLSFTLSGGRHVLWDYQPHHQYLNVGKELASQLNYSAIGWDSGAAAKFREIIHPLDLAAYDQMIKWQRLRTGARLELELRLKASGGFYHWYVLKALAIPGPGNGVDRCIGTITNIDKLKRVEERISIDTLRDAVTGLPNKALFLDRLDRNLAMPGAVPRRVVIVGLHRFKMFNENLGQDFCDRLLKITADRICALAGAEVTVARLAGSRFAVEFIETPERGDIKNFLKEIEQAMALPIKLGQQQVVIGASIGVSSTSRGGLTPAELLVQAKVAMIERADGGAGVTFYHAEMKNDGARKISLETDLRHALSQNEIEIHYQPIVYLATLDVAGFEALLRWRHPEFGLLSPIEFMDVAEAAGLMPEIGQFILAGAGRQLGIWQRVHRRSRPFFVSVNISVTQLMAPLFPRHVQHVLERESLEPGSLKLEITETVIMRHPERAAHILGQLQAMGVGLACDDFGTGFSSLSSLRDFPFDTLKIDRSFIAPDNFTERNGKIISSITALAQSLNMVVVGEGIETQEQIDNLAALNCGLGQGYFIGVPELADQASERLQSLNILSSQNQALSTELRSDGAPTPDAVPINPNGETNIPDDQMVAEELPSIFVVPKLSPEKKTKAKKPRAKRKSNGGVPATHV